MAVTIAGFAGFAGATTVAVVLLTDGYTFAATHTGFADISATQIPAGNGYTQADGAGAGKFLASVTSGQPAAGTWMLDAADVQWTASGGPIPGSGNCDNASTFSDATTTPANALLHNIDFGVNESAGDGTTFNINWNANGICRIT
jgi:hypothetical protein